MVKLEGDAIVAQFQKSESRATMVVVFGKRCVKVLIAFCKARPGGRVGVTR